MRNVQAAAYYQANIPRHCAIFAMANYFTFIPKPLHPAPRGSTDHDYELGVVDERQYEPAAMTMPTLEEIWNEREMMPPPTKPLRWKETASSILGVVGVVIGGTIVVVFFSTCGKLEKSIYLR